MKRIMYIKEFGAYAIVKQKPYHHRIIDWMLYSIITLIIAAIGYFSGLLFLMYRVT